MRAHTAPRVAVVDTRSWPRPHPVTGRSGAAAAALLLLLSRRRQDLGPVCWSHCWREGGWTGRMTGERTPKRLISNKKENSSLYTVVVLVQYKQNKKSLL